jgi:VCBS repeat-containing protein
MALTTISNSPSVLYGSGNGESYGFAPGATYVFGGGGNDNFLASSNYTALYSGDVQDYAFTVAMEDNGNDLLFIEDLRIGSPDGVDRYEGDNGSLGFGFDSNAIAANQVLDLRSAQDLKAALPSAPNHLPTAVLDTISLSEDQALEFNVVANDIDLDSDSLRAVALYNPPGNSGSASLDFQGDITYSAIGSFDKLALGHTATESFTYIVSDGHAGSDEGYVDVTITGANDTPIARPDQITLSQDQARTFSPLLNDEDVDQGDALRIVEVTSQPGNQGLVDISSDALSLTYTADDRFDHLPAGQTGFESFSYTVEDDHGARAQSEVNVTIVGNNDKPSVVDDSISLTEDQALKFDPAINDTDVDQGQTVRPSSVTQSSGNNGVAVVDQDGNVTFSAIGNFDHLGQGDSATEVFYYTGVDGYGGSDTATVSVTIQGVNDAPIAQRDQVIVGEDSNLNFNPSGNDVELDQGDNLRTVDVFNPIGNAGTAYLSSDGRAVYETNGAFESLPVGGEATETFYYEVSDDHSSVDQGQVDITIKGVNDNPVALPDTVSVSEDQTIEIDVTQNDSDIDQGDSLNVLSVTSPSTNKGQVVFQAGRVIYNPVDRFDDIPLGGSASETFEYTIADGNGGYDSTSVTVEIQGENDAPQASSDAYQLNQGETISVDPASNDTDIDRDDLLKVSGVSSRPGSIGSINLDPSGSVTYSASAGFESLSQGETATETFDYTVSDQHGATDQAEATVTVVGVNDTPVASDDQIVVSEEQILEAADTLLLANDTDVDRNSQLKVSGVIDNSSNNDALSYTSSSGRVVYNPVGKFDYLSEGDQESATFTYSVSDEYGATHQAQVDVTITGVNDAPVANQDAVNVSQNGSHTFDPTDNDTDVDLGDTRRVTSVSNPTENYGTAVLDPVTARVTYSTGPGFDYLAQGEQASETFSYTVEDRFNGTDQGNVVVTITGVNDAPEAVNDVQYIPENSSKAFDPTLNDRDVDNGDVLHLSSAELNSGARGEIEILANGQIHYNSSNKFDELPQGSSATESLTYSVSDQMGYQSIGTVDIVITGVNDAPISRRDILTFLEDVNANSISQDVLINDSDIDLGDTIFVLDYDQGSVRNSVLSLVEGDLIFSPSGYYDDLKEGEIENASFTYIAQDTFGASSDRTTVDVNIKGVNDAPSLISFRDLLVTESGATDQLAIADVASDLDAGDVVRFDEPQQSAANINGSNGGRFIVSPGGSEISFDPSGEFEYLSDGQAAVSSYQFRVHDSYGATQDGVLNAVVVGANDSPELLNDYPIIYRIGEDFSSTTLDLVSDGRVFDVDQGDVLKVDKVEASALVGLTIDRTSDLSSLVISKMSSGKTYQGVLISDYGYDDFDSLDHGETLVQDVTLTFIDEAGETVEAAMKFEIQGRNDAPIRIDGEFTDLGWQPLTTPTRITQEQLMDSAFYDVDDEPLSVSEVIISSGGGTLLAVEGEQGVWDYMPDAAGDVSIAFTVTDGDADLAAVANMVVVPPFLADAGDRYVMSQSNNGYWQVQEYASDQLEVEIGNAITLNDGRGNSYGDQFLPEGYTPVGFDAVHVSGDPQSDAGSQWNFNLVLRGDDPITGDSGYRVQSFVELDTSANGAREATSLRNDEVMTAAEVVLLETELFQNYSDDDNWKQVDMDGDGYLGLDFAGDVLAQSGDIKVIDAGPAMLLHREQISVDQSGELDYAPVDLTNSDMLTTADGANAFQVDGYLAAAVSNLDGYDQVIFAGSTANAPNYSSQAFEDNGQAVGVNQIVNSQDFEEATQLGQQADQQQEAFVSELVATADPSSNIAEQVIDEVSA